MTQLLMHQLFHSKLKLIQEEKRYEETQKTLEEARKSNHEAMTSVMKTRAEVEKLNKLLDEQMKRITDLQQQQTVSPAEIRSTLLPLFLMTCNHIFLTDLRVTRLIGQMPSFEKDTRKQQFIEISKLLQAAFQLPVEVCSDPDYTYFSLCIGRDSLPVFYSLFEDDEKRKMAKKCIFHHLSCVLSAINRKYSGRVPCNPLPACVAEHVKQLSKRYLQDSVTVSSCQNLRSLCGLVGLELVENADDTVSWSGGVCLEKSVELAPLSDEWAHELEGRSDSSADMVISTKLYVCPLCYRQLEKELEQQDQCPLKLLRVYTERMVEQETAMLNIQSMLFTTAEAWHKHFKLHDSRCTTTFLKRNELVPASAWGLKRMTVDWAKKRGLCGSSIDTSNWFRNKPKITRFYNELVVGVTMNRVSPVTPLRLEVDLGQYDWTGRQGNSPGNSPDTTDTTTEPASKRQKQ